MDQQIVLRESPHSMDPPKSIYIVSPPPHTHAHTYNIERNICCQHSADTRSRCLGLFECFNMITSYTPLLCEISAACKQLCEAAHSNTLNYSYTLLIAALTCCGLAGMFAMCSILIYSLHSPVSCKQTAAGADKRCPEGICQ